QKRTSARSWPRRSAPELYSTGRIAVRRVVRSRERAGQPTTATAPHPRSAVPRKILIICHANTSRSVIAEALLKQMLRERALDDRSSVQSGGIAPFARDGALVSLDARLVLRDEGIHLPPDSVATDLKNNRHLISEADLILAMTDEQIAMLNKSFPEAAGKEI